MNKTLKSIIIGIVCISAISFWIYIGINKDPEIAAHLGEILWLQGKKEEAKEIWKNSLNRHPSNTVLLETTNRFR